MAREEDTSTADYAEPNPNIQNDFVYTSKKTKECNDVFFLLVFLAVIIMTIFFAANYGNDFVKATEFIDAEANKSTGYKAILKYLSYCGLSAVVISLAWIIIMILVGEFLIWAALLLIIFINAAVAVFFTKELYKNGEKYYYWPAIVFGSLALLSALYACCIRKRVKFAAKHLKVAGSAVLSLPMTIMVAFVMVFVQFAWFITWFLGNLGIMFHADYITVSSPCTITKCDIDTNWGEAIGITFGMLVVFFWGSIVVENIVQVTVSGAVGSWRIKSNASMITIMAWIRAMTLSLGSICFGSLFVAILETIQQLLNTLSWAANSSGNCVAACLFGCLSCIVGCIEYLLEFFNRFAYTYVGVYGYSFITASKHVFKLFKNRGWSAIVNDNLTGNVFWMGKLLIGGLCAWIGVAFVDNADIGTFDNISKPKWLIGVGAFLLGYAIGHIFMGVMASAVTTVFVLWAEDPQGWQLSHSDHYASLHAAWLEIYPEEYNNGHGKSNLENQNRGNRNQMTHV